MLRDRGLVGVVRRVEKVVKFEACGGVGRQKRTNFWAVTR
jgi:hypothetical protein